MKYHTSTHIPHYNKLYNTTRIHEIQHSNMKYHTSRYIAHLNVQNNTYCIHEIPHLNKCTTFNLQHQHEYEILHLNKCITL